MVIRHYDFRQDTGRCEICGKSRAWSNHNKCAKVRKARRNELEKRP